ncbi:MAG: L-threonylcarbamoyladenylate synthase [Flavobacteriales bacterium]
MLLEIHPQNPEERKLKQVVKCLMDGGVIIFPTDTIYAVGCLLTKSKALERVARIKGVKPNKANFSLICSSLSYITDYVKNPDNHTFKVMKRALPGPYTFILHAGNKIPKFFNNNRKEVGIRVPDHRVPLLLVEMCGCPLVATSIKDEDQVVEYTTDPELIHERLGKEVDLVIHSGFGHNIASTIIDCTGDTPVVTREGMGTIHVL